METNNKSIKEQKRFSRCNPYKDEMPVNHSNNYAHYLSEHKVKMKRSPKRAPSKHKIQKLCMTEKVYQEIKRSIGVLPAETGGILICENNDLVVTDFIFDKGAVLNTQTVYQPNSRYLNWELKHRNGLFYGVVHSHKPKYRQLSDQDRNAAWSNLTSPDNSYLNAYLMPIVQTIPDNNTFEIIPYIVTCNPNGNGEVDVHNVPLEIVKSKMRHKNENKNVGKRN